MSIYFRWGGIALLMIAALCINRGYKDYLDRRLSEFLGLFSLVEHAKDMISKFLSYGKELWRDYSDEQLEKCGLLSALREGKSLSEAFDMCKENMALSKESKQKLSHHFKKLGSGYKDGEISKLEELKTEIGDMLSVESREAEKNKSVVSALLLGGALALAIMIM